VEEEKSTPSNPVYKPITLPDFQNGNVSLVEPGDERVRRFGIGRDTRGVNG